VPTPSCASIERGNWLDKFQGPAYSIERDGDTVRVTSYGTGTTVCYPWARVAGCEELTAVEEDKDDGTFIRPVTVSRQKSRKP
jgi:hypothetical protein